MDPSYDAVNRCCESKDKVYGSNGLSSNQDNYSSVPNRHFDVLGPDKSMILRNFANSVYIKTCQDPTCPPNSLKA